MKILYFDCFSGIAGDMVLGSLIDAGLDVNILVRDLKKLKIKGYEIRCAKVMRNALSGTKLDCLVKHSSCARSHRSLVEILKLIDDSSLKSTVKENAKKIFNTIGKAESKIHGISDKKKIHLHELGDIDSIVDIVGVAIAVDALGIDRLHLGHMLGGGAYVLAAVGEAWSTGAAGGVEGVEAIGIAGLALGGERGWVEAEKRDPL